MKTFPRIYCNASLLAVAVLFGSSLGLAQTSNTDSPAGSLSVAAAQSQVGSNRPVQLAGELEIIHQDLNNGHSRNVYSLKLVDGTRVPLQFVKNPPTHLLTGDHVRASGQLSGGSLVLYSGNTNLAKTSPSGAQKPAPAPPPPPIPVPYTFGAQSTLVMLVNFQDDVVEPYTVTDAQNVFFGTASNFFLENSYGQTWLTGDVVGWYTIPVSVTTCDMSQISTDAQNAAVAAGVTLSNYTRYVYAFPYNTVCGFAGASDVGGNPSETWINGTTGPGGTILNIHVIDHELGHAFGLLHSHLYDCGTSATICSSPNIVEYGDLLDTMGAPQTASPDYNAFQKERLGWLNYGASPSIQTVTTSGTYTINTYEVNGSGPNALKIWKSTDPTTGAKTWYYLEARQAVGFDAFLLDWAYYTQNETTGVLFHIGTDGDDNSADQLDMTPATPTDNGWFDPSLVTGQSFQDAAAAVSFAPTSVNSSGATVQITFGPVCAAAVPTVSVSPSQSQYVTSGTAVNFTATVTDKDSSACAPATFNLGDSLPSGWAGVWNTTALSLSPGKSGSATLTVTSPVGNADGSYPVSVSATNASNSSYSGSAAATYVINTAPLSISMTTNQSSYLPGQTVTVTVTMLYGTLPDAGASATVTVTPPSGRAATLRGTTGSNGVASLSYNLSKHAPAGTYQVQYGTPVNGANAMLGVGISFTVQ
jgi:M6 family metalloprotease-like protein